MQVIFDQKEYCLYEKELNHHLINLLVYNEGLSGLIAVNVCNAAGQSFQYPITEHSPFSASHEKKQFLIDLTKVRFLQGKVGMNLGSYRLGVRIGGSKTFFFPFVLHVLYMSSYTTATRPPAGSTPPPPAPAPLPPPPPPP